MQDDVQQEHQHSRRISDLIRELECFKDDLEVKVSIDNADTVYPLGLVASYQDEFCVLVSDDQSEPYHPGSFSDDELSEYDIDEFGLDDEYVEEIKKIFDSSLSTKQELFLALKQVEKKLEMNFSDSIRNTVLLLHALKT